MTSKNNLNSIGFKSGIDFYSADQFDIRFNRPDIVLKRLGFASDEIIEMYRKAYERRLEKLGFTEDMFLNDWHTPDVKITNLSEIDISTDENNILIDILATDSKYPIDRINIWVNDVPIFGLNGISYRNKNLQEVVDTYSIELMVGVNNIQFSCLNKNAVESRKELIEVVYHPKVEEKPNLYIIAVSVSDYGNEKINLKYAQKDGRDIVDLFTTTKYLNKQYNNIYIDTLFNSNATLLNFLNLRKKLISTKVNDKVIVFFSGHGVLDQDLNFYFATTDIDFKNPQEKGISFTQIEAFLDSIPARQKLLLLDACHSGEVDKGVLSPGFVEKQEVLDSIENNQVFAYNTKSISLNIAQTGLGMNNSFDLMKEMFVGLDKGTGSVAISAASGLGYAIESNKWQNGVFTYTILYGLKHKKADKNKDGIITVTELKNYSIKEVERLTNGKQKPTSRKENLEFDWRVW